MQIDIQARNFSLTTALRHHVDRRLGFVLEGRHDNVQRVMVRLSDVNGPRGGNDKCCLIHLRLPGQADVVVEDTRFDLYSAIDRAAERTRRTLARKQAKQTCKSRGAAIHRHGLPESFDPLEPALS